MSRNSFSQSGLLQNQSNLQLDLYKNGYLISEFKDQESLRKMLSFLKEEVNKFNQGNKIKWKRTFGGAYDLVNDDFLVDFVKVIINRNEIMLNRIYLADKLRIYTWRSISSMA